MRFNPAHIDLLEPCHSRVQKFVDSMFASKPLIAPAAIMFGGDRMACVNAVAILTVNGVDAGIATLSERGEENTGEPAIVAIWIDPELKGNEHYLYWGRMLFERLVDECKDRLGLFVKPVFYPISRTEMQIAEEAQKHNVDFVLKTVTLREMLQDW